MGVNPTEAELVEWQRRRFTPPDAARRLQLAAEHESAHAVVALALDVPVHCVWVDESGAGQMIFDAVEAWDRRTRAAIAIAPQLWVGWRFMAFPEGDNGCQQDTRELWRDAGDGWARAEAGRLASRILREREDDVLAMARRLLSSPRLTVNFDLPDDGDDGVGAMVGRMMRRSNGQGQMGCDCRVSMLDIERIFQEVGLSSAGTVTPFSANRIRAIAREVGVKVARDVFGRDSVTRDEAVSIVERVRAQRQANIDEQHAAAVAAAKSAGDAAARSRASAAAAQQAETDRLVARHGEHVRRMTWAGRSTLQ